MLLKVLVSTPISSPDWFSTLWLKSPAATAPAANIVDILVENGKLIITSLLNTDSEVFESKKLDWTGDEIKLTDGSKIYKLTYGSTGINLRRTAR